MARAGTGPDQQSLGFKNQHHRRSSNLERGTREFDQWVVGEGADLPEPSPLKSPHLWGFAGVDNSKGLAFVLEAGDTWLYELTDSPFLRPYVSGEDLGSRPPGVFKRWVIDCGDLSLEAVQSLHEPTSRFLDEVVRPTRTSEDLKSHKGLADRWWQFASPRVQQFERVTPTRLASSFRRWPLRAPGSGRNDDLLHEQGDRA